MPRSKRQQEQVEQLIQMMQAIITDLPRFGNNIGDGIIDYSNYTPAAKVRAILALPGIGIIDSSQQGLRDWVALIPKE